MALISVENIAPDVRLALWYIEETTEELLKSDTRLGKVMPSLKPYHCRERLRDKLVVYELVFLLTGGMPVEIMHLPNGKPSIKGWRISISDTRGYAAVMISKNKNVAIDIEYFSNRVMHVSHKFIRPDECAETTSLQLINWSAKETVYKYFSEQKLQYFDMRLLPFCLAERGEVGVENLKQNTTLSVYYRINSAFVLTYAWGESGLWE